MKKSLHSLSFTAEAAALYLINTTVNKLCAKKGQFDYGINLNMKIVF
ncbi:hypothetical protein ACFFJX_17585 [Pseudarcicella hirudinis]